FSTFAISDKKRPTSSGARRIMIFDSKRMGSPLNVDGSVRQKLCSQSSTFPAGLAMIDANPNSRIPEKANRRRKLARTPDYVPHPFTIPAQTVILYSKSRRAESMKSLLESPLAVSALSMVAMWFATQIGISYRRRTLPLQEGEQHDFNLVIPATLT